MVNTRRNSRNIQVDQVDDAHNTPLSPFNSPLQNKYASSQTFDKPPAVCVVTGGTGFVGQRLVEMLVERGAERVVSFDIVPPPADR